VPDLRQNHPIFHRLARRDFLQCHVELAIGYSSFVLEHFPESLNEPGFLFGRTARTDRAYNRRNRFRGDIRVTSRIGWNNRMDEFAGTLIAVLCIRTGSTAITSLCWAESNPSWVIIVYMLFPAPYEAIAFTHAIDEHPSILRPSNSRIAFGAWKHMLSFGNQCGFERGRSASRLKWIHKRAHGHALKANHRARTCP
jgi:hypothetical protein